MLIEFHTKKKLGAFVAQVDQLLLSDFPHPSTRSALNLIRSSFSDQSTRIDRAVQSKNSKLIAQACTTVNERIYSYLPILGFLLRSTNVRNNFEAYDAFFEIAKSLIGVNAEVIMSSEWDFSPITYPMTVSLLPNYVLLGMPTSESSNSLILPLAGHELGHSVWQNDGLESKYSKIVDEKIKLYLRSRWSEFQNSFKENASLQPTDDEIANNMFIVYVVSDINRLCSMQIEEIFCDAIGAHIFGDSYAYAFHYLLAPSLGGERSLEYPTLSNRAEFIEKYGRIKLEGSDISRYSAEFSDLQRPLGARDGFVSKAADFIAIELAEEVYKEAGGLVTNRASRYMPNSDSISEILRMFKNGIPAKNPRSLSDIISAGWAYVRSARGTFDETQRPIFEWTSELVLKSIEVLEYKRRTTGA